MKPSQASLLAQLTLTSAFSLVTVSGFADQTWKGTTDNSWTTTGNWSGNAIPGSSDLVVYNSSSTANLSNQFSTTFSIKGISFSNPTGAVSINSASTLTCGASGINMTNATQTLTINAPVALGASQVWVVATNQTLTMAGIVSGGFGLYKDSGGVLYLNGANTFTGNFTNNGGAVWINNNAALGSGTKTIYIANNALGAGLHLNGTNGNITLPTTMSYVVSEQYGAIINEAGNNTIGGGINVFSGGGYGYILANAGSLTLNGAITLGTTARPITLGGAAIGTNNGGITGSGFPFRKVDSGSWTFTGNNPYTGYTTVEGGTLLLVTNAKIAGTTNITVFANATLDVSQLSNSAALGTLFLAANQVLAGSGTINGSVSTTNGNAIQPGSLNVAQTAGGMGVAGTLTISTNLAMFSTTTNYFELNTATTVGSGVNDLISVGNNLDPQSARIFVTALSAPTTGSPYRLINYTGSKLSSFNPTVLTDTHYTFTLDETVANQVNVTVGAGPNLVWYGSTANWDFNTTANWNSGTLVFLNWDPVTFDDTGSSTNITLVGTLKPASINFTNSVVNYQLQGSGKITGLTGLTKSGSGLLNITTTGSDYTGSVTVNGGTLQVSSVALNGSASSLGAGTNVTLNGGTFQFAGARPAASSFNRFWTMGSNGGTILSVNGTFFIPNQISGPGSLTKSGSVQIILGDIVTGALTNANNSYAGNTFITQGELQIRNAHALGFGKAVVSAGADLAVGGGANYGTITNNIDLNGGDGSGSAGTLQVNDGGTAVTFGGTINLLADSSVGTVNNGNAVTYIISGPVIGTGALKKLGTNTVTLTSPSNTYSGNTVISNGTLALGAGAALNPASSISISGGATFDVSGLGASATFTLGSGGLTASGTASPANIKGGATGTVNLGSQPITLNYDGSHPALTNSQGTLELNGNAFTVNGSALAVGSYTIVASSAAINGSGSFTVSGTAIGSGKAGSISVSGNTVILKIVNTTTTSVGLSSGVNPSTYGGALTFQATVSPAPADGETINFMDGVTTIGTGPTAGGVATLPISTLAAASHSITAVYPGDNNNLGSTSTPFTQTVNPAPLGITANNATKIYGQTKTFAGTEFAAVGLQNGESVAFVTLTPGGGTAATDPVGGYNIVPSAATGGTFSTANYTIAYNNGTLTVTPLGVTATADAKTKVYGASDPALTYHSTPALVGSDSFNGALSRVAGEAVGNYAITQGTLALSTNYTLTYVGTNLSISPAALLVAANDTNRAYGATNPVFTATITGFVNGDSATNSDVAGAASLTTSADTNSIVGTYDIDAAQGTLTSTNYTFNFTNGTLTILPAAITVTADPQTRGYGATNPTLTATYSGFINGDTASVISGSPALSVSADTNAAVGDYTITVGQGDMSATNYAFTLVDSTLNVTPAGLGITANDAVKVYGGTLSFAGTEFAAVGLQNGETVGTVTLTPSGGIAATDPVGGYSIVPSAATGGTFSAGNYAITYNNGTLTVNPLGVTATADAKTKVYGAADPALTYQSAPALVGSDSFNGALSRVAGEAVGNYTIGQGTLSLSFNYTLTYVSANLSITPATLTVTANNASKVYGQTLTFAGTEFTTSPLFGSDSVNSVTLTSSGGAASAAVTNYPIVPSAAVGSGLGNYTITYVNGTLTVIPATPVTISNPVILPDGTVQLNFSGGNAGLSYQIQAISDLTTPAWTSLATNEADTNGLPSFIDLDATNYPQRFYRAVGP